MTIEIKNFRNMNEGALRGEFAVFLPKMGLLIRKFRVLENEKGRWIGFPSFSFEKEGERKWCPYFQFMDQNTSEKFKEGVLKAVESHLKDKEDEDSDDMF